MSRWSGWIKKTDAWFRRSPRAAGLLLIVLALALYGGTAGLRMFRYGSESALVGFGCVPNAACFARENQSVLPNNVLVYTTGGYDGQFFFYYAAELYGGPRAALDFRPLRAIRVGYPALTGWVYPLFGPGALVAAMTLVPLCLHLLLLAFLWRERALVGVGACVLFALNPFSLKSLLLNAADGLALSFALAAVLLLRHDGRAVRRSLIFGGILLSLALLTKETMFAAALGAGTAFALSATATVAGAGMRGRERAAFAGLLAVALAIIPVLLWWRTVDFHLADAGNRGTFPFAGVLSYLSHPDAILSGRSVLVLILPVYGIACGAFLWESDFSPGARYLGASRRLLLRIGGFGLLAALGLISFASAGEYWSNFSNIVRLFAAGFPPLILGLSRSRLGQRYGWVAYVLLFVLTVIIIRDEAVARLLTFEIWK